MAAFIRSFVVMSEGLYDSGLFFGKGLAFIRSFSGIDDRTVLFAGSFGGLSRYRRVEYEIFSALLVGKGDLSGEVIVRPLPNAVIEVVIRELDAVTA